ncbi:hypothetical protein NRIC_16530 [Enterococcus florum]|uniref:Uncharacterized protein n=1 Tax=Enterococcus florum TaxID=2480627 RepID=A0A4P5PDU4_9ENTE|nr:hypothetical protein NRIC_16530 [Enterococcus florum]
MKLQWLVKPSLLETNELKSIGPSLKWMPRLIFFLFMKHFTIPMILINLQKLALSLLTDFWQMAKLDEYY